MQALRDIFGIWSSIRNMADDLNRPYDTVLAWRIRKRIPEDAWQDVIDAAKRRGKNLTVAQILTWNAPLGRRGRVRTKPIRVKRPEERAN